MRSSARRSRPDGSEDHQHRGACPTRRGPGATGRSRENAVSSSVARSDSPSTSARAMGAVVSGNVASIRSRSLLRARSIHASGPTPRVTTRTSSAPPDFTTRLRASRGRGSPPASFHMRSGVARSAMTYATSPRARSSWSPQRGARPTRGTRVSPPSRSQSTSRMSPSHLRTASPSRLTRTGDVTTSARNEQRAGGPSALIARTRTPSWVWIADDARRAPMASPTSERTATGATFARSRRRGKRSAPDGASPGLGMREARTRTRTRTRRTSRRSATSTPTGTGADGTTPPSASAHEGMTRTLSTPPLEHLACRIVPPEMRA